MAPSYPVPGECAAGAREDLARRSARWASETFGMSVNFTKTYGRTILLAMPQRSRTLPASLTAEVVSSTGTAMTFVALPWFVLVNDGLGRRA